MICQNYTKYTEFDDASSLFEVFSQKTHLFLHHTIIQQAALILFGW